MRTIWIQEALGHMPFPATTVVHVPLGVALFGFSLHLAQIARLSGSARSCRPVGQGLLV